MPSGSNSILAAVNSFSLKSKKREKGGNKALEQKDGPIEEAHVEEPSVEIAKMPHPHAHPIPLKLDSQDPDNLARQLLQYFPTHRVALIVDIFLRDVKEDLETIEMKLKQAQELKTAYQNFSDNTSQLIDQHAKEGQKYGIFKRETPGFYFKIRDEIASLSTDVTQLEGKLQKHFATYKPLLEASEVLDQLSKDEGDKIRQTSYATYPKMHFFPDLDFAQGNQVNMNLLNPQRRLQFACRDADIGSDKPNPTIFDVKIRYWSAFKVSPISIIVSKDGIYACRILSAAKMYSFQKKKEIYEVQIALPPGATYRIKPLHEDKGQYVSISIDDENVIKSSMSDALSGELNLDGSPVYRLHQTYYAVSMDYDRREYMRI